MDEKFKMQPFMQNYAYFAFLFEKGSKKLFYAGFSTKYELCIPSED